jgi:hypothetical protein
LTARDKFDIIISRQSSSFVGVWQSPSPRSNSPCTCVRLSTGPAAYACYFIDVGLLYSNISANQMSFSDGSTWWNQAGYTTPAPPATTTTTTATPVSGFDSCGTTDWGTNDPALPRSAGAWYVDPRWGTGVCSIGDKLGVAGCRRICASIQGCNYYSTSTTMNCYACFVWKNCPNPKKAFPASYFLYPMGTMCSSSITAIITSTDSSLCVPSTGGRVQYTGRTCGSGQISWTSAEALDIRPGLTASQCKWDWTTHPNGQFYAGTCGVSPPVNGGSQLPTACTTTTTTIAPISGFDSCGTTDWGARDPALPTSAGAWYVDSQNGFGTGVCNIGDKLGVAGCQRICASIQGCKYYSTSITTPCYACFVWKSCPNPRKAVVGGYFLYPMPTS